MTKDKIQKTSVTRIRGLRADAETSRGGTHRLAKEYKIGEQEDRRTGGGRDVGLPRPPLRGLYNISKYNGICENDREVY